MEVDIITEVGIDEAVACGSSRGQEDLGEVSVVEVAAAEVSVASEAEALVVAEQVGIGKYRVTRPAGRDKGVERSGKREEGELHNLFILIPFLDAFLESLHQ